MKIIFNKELLDEESTQWLLSAQFETVKGNIFNITKIEEFDFKYGITLSSITVDGWRDEIVMTTINLLNKYYVIKLRMESYCEEEECHQNHKLPFETLGDYISVAPTKSARNI